MTLFQELSLSVYSSIQFMMLMWACVCINGEQLWALEVDDLENELHCCKWSHMMSAPGVSYCAAVFRVAFVKPSKSLVSNRHPTLHNYLELSHPRCVFNIKVQCKEVKTSWDIAIKVPTPWVICIYAPSTPPQLRPYSFFSAYCRKIDKKYMMRSQHLTA
jgi:hypothetical protein